MVVFKNSFSVIEKNCFDIKTRNHKQLIIFNIETLHGDHKKSPVSIHPLKYYLLLLTKLNYVKIGLQPLGYKA